MTMAAAQATLPNSSPQSEQPRATAPASSAQTAPAANQIDYSTVEEMLRRGNAVQFQGEKFLGANKLEIPQFQNLYESNTCREGSTGSVSNWAILRPPFICTRGNYDYWEPAAIVEVSCQTGYSLLKPNQILAQSPPTVGGKPVQPGQCGTGPNWFFEVRVWASNPKPWGDRTVILGGNFWEQTGGAMCSGQGTRGAGMYPFGYGIKYPFTQGSATGPAGSLESYVSDNDLTWGRNLDPERRNITEQIEQRAAATAAEVQTLIKAQQGEQRCEVGQPNVEKCWGKARDEFTGWVTHPNRAVAAALASYRGVLKAQSMNTMARDIQGGLRLSMDYPFVKTPSAYAQSIGAEGQQGNPRHRGSDCFVPGDGGPWWYTSGKLNTDPNQPLMPALRSPNLEATANADAGVYIFTYWVKTRCVVHNSPICGSDRYIY
jgi:hypothetical protein